MQTDDTVKHTKSAFVPAQPKELSERALAVLFRSDRKDNILEREAMQGRLESTVAAWITAGEIENLALLSGTVLKGARTYRYELAEKLGISSADMASLSAVALLEFAEHFAATPTMAQGLSLLIAPKRVNWRRGLIGVSQLDGPWSAPDFMRCSGLAKSSAYDALEELEARNMVTHSDDEGTRVYSLTPLAWGIVKRLKKQFPHDIPASNDVEDLRTEKWAYAAGTGPIERCYFENDPALESGFSKLQADIELPRVVTAAQRAAAQPA